MKAACLLSLALFGAAGSAYAGEDPVAEAAAAIRAVVRSPAPDVAALDQTVERLWVDVADLSSPVEIGVWTELLLDLTVARYQLRRPWEAPRVAAAWARPDLPVPVGPSLSALRDWQPPAPVGATPLPHQRVVWMDGVRRVALPELAGLHLLQGTRCGVWSSTLVEGAAAVDARTRWYDTCPAPPWRRRDASLVGSGAGMVAVGLVTAIASWAIAQSDPDAPVPTVFGRPLTPQTRRALIASNAAGWSAVGIGVGLTLPGAVLRARAVRRAHASP